ncbi:MAG: glycosyltransferase [Nanoarchaeota archaeon]|nr:glycosyltransferase [Nanoarchaeota archaeon]
MKDTLIVAPGKGWPRNEAWTKEIALVSEKLGVDVIASGKIGGLFSKKGRYLIIRHSILLYWVFALVVFFRSLAYKRVLLECTPGSLYFRMLVGLIGRKKIVYHLRDPEWRISSHELSQFKSVVVPYALKKAPGAIVFAFGIESSSYSVASKKHSGFTFLFASAPLQHHDFEQIFDEKGVVLLLDAFSRLELKGKRLILIWRGAYYSELMGIIRKMYADLDIEVVNEVVDLASYYARSDVTVLCAQSREHTPAYPSSLMESVVAGTPVVVSSLLPIAQVIKKEGFGVVCESGSLLSALEMVHKKHTSFVQSCKNRGIEVFDIKKSLESLKKGLENS